MSLDVYLELPGGKKQSKGSGIFVRQNGQTVEISRDEWDRQHPDVEPCTFTSGYENDRVYSANITHNLNKMAGEAGIYQACWRPEEIGITQAKQLIPLLEAGLAKLKADPKHFEQFNASNGWGLYEHFVPWVEEYLAACREYPEATVSVSR